MQTVELAHRDWAGALQSFGEMHRTWLVSLEVMGSNIGAQPEAHDIPLAGIAAESAGKRETISVFLERSPEQHLAHIIHDPTHVRIERTDEGIDVAMQVESADGTTTILTLKTPMRADMVDSITRPH